MSFHSPTLPKTQTTAECAEPTCCQASYQTTGNGSGRFQIYSWTPLNLAYCGRLGHVNYRPAEPSSLSLVIPMCFPPSTTNVQSCGPCPSTTESPAPGTKRVSHNTAEDRQCLWNRSAALGTMCIWVLVTPLLTHGSTAPPRQDLLLENFKRKKKNHPKR